MLVLVSLCVLVERFMLLANRFEATEVICLLLLFVSLPLISAATPTLKPYVPELADAAAI